MSVKYLVDDIEEKCPGWGAAKILRKLNEWQNYVYSQPSLHTVYIDPATGFPPYITTTAGTFKYDVPNVTKNIGGTDYSLRIYKVSRVFVDITSYDDYDIPYLGEPFEFYGANPYSTKTEKLYFAQVPVESSLALENTAASITFKSDPGTTTDDFFVEGVIEPLQLTSQSLPLTLPKRFERALFDAVVGETQDQAYGQDSRLTRFHEYWLPLIWGELNSGAKATSPHTPPLY